MEAIIFLVGVGFVVFLWIAISASKPSAESDTTPLERQLLAEAQVRAGLELELEAEAKQNASSVQIAGGKKNGTWQTTASLPVVFEKIEYSLRNYPIHPNRKYRWRNVQASQPYREIICNAEWEDEDKLSPSGWVNTASVILTLTFEPDSDGGTQIRYAFDCQAKNLFNFDLFIEKLVTATSERITKILVHLNQHPEDTGPIF